MTAAPNPSGLASVTRRHLAVQASPLAGGGRLQTEAGELAQIVDGEPFRSLASIEFLPDAIRARHFHDRKVETLYLIEGTLHAVFVDVDTHAVGRLVVEAGDIVTVQPRCAHMYRAVEHAWALELAPDRYDAQDTFAFDFEPFVPESLARRAGERASLDR
jgi:quercetin dioxygenase-like cupin family protein